MQRTYERNGYLSQLQKCDVTSIIIIVVVIICSLCDPPCVSDRQSTERKKDTGLCHCLFEAKSRYACMQILSHKAARDVVKLDICSKGSHGHCNFSEKPLSVLHRVIGLKSSRKNVIGKGGGERLLHLLCCNLLPLHTGTAQYGLSLSK